MPSRPGRRPKTYCSNACKQTAYYHRRKTFSAGDAIVTHNDFVTEAPQGNEQHEQHPPTYNLLQKTPSMERHTLSAEHNTVNESTLPQSISVMGMEVDKEWFTGLLATLPQDQQRQLSRLLLQTITDVFPDLTDEMDISHSDPYYDSSVTDNSSHLEYGQEEEDNGEENYRDGSDGNEGEDAEGNPETDDSEDGHYRSEEGDEEGYENEDENRDGENNDGENDNSGIKAYRLNASSDSETSRQRPQQRDGHSTSFQQSVVSRNSNNVNQVANPRVDDQARRGQLSGYLTRFNSPRIRRGLTIWEELCVTIPSFMEDYVMHFASDAGMLVHPADAKKGGLVTANILFHLAEHRRSICRLLDLVLEAEDGILCEQDFRAGGAFAAGETAIEDFGNEVPDDGAIDYDCFDSPTASGMRRQGGSRHITAHDIAMYNNIKAVRQFVQPGTWRA